MDRFGLRLHLAIAFLLTTALLGLAFGLIVGDLVASDLERRIADRLVELADEVGGDIDHEVGERRDDLAAAAASLGARPAEHRASVQQAWVEALAASPGRYSWVAFTDAGGRVVGSSSRDLAVGAQQGDAPWFLKGSLDPVVIDEAAYLPAGSTKPRIVIATPVRDVSGRLLGVLAAQLGRPWAEQLYSDTLQREHKVDGTEVYVVDSLDRPIIGPNSLEATQLPTGLLVPGSREVAIRSGLAWPDGGHYLSVATARLSSHSTAGLGWRVVARRDAQQAMAPAITMRNHIFIVGALLALAGALAGAVASHRIAQPLVRIAAAASRIRAGEFGIEIPHFHYFNEVAVLSTSLRDMVLGLRRNEARLAALNDTLERRVVERTSEIARAHQELGEQEGLLRAVFDAALDGVMIVDENGVVESFNAACEDIFGWQADEIIGRAVTLLMPAEVGDLHRAQFRPPPDGQPRMDGVIGHTRTVQGERMDGRSFPLEISLSQASHGGRTVYVSIVRDITAAVEAREHMFVLATEDGLTGVRNRRYFLEGAEAEFTRAKRHERGLALMIIDADHFKLVNDTFGHDAGDRVLRCLTDVCRANLRGIDQVGRIGGEEFAVAMPEIDVDTARAVADRIRILLSGQVVTVEGQEIRFTVSIGVALAEERDHSLHDLIRRADQALYQAKNAGRNRVVMAVRGPHLVKSDEA